MLKIIGLFGVGVLLFLFQHSASTTFARYKAVEAYEIRPGVLMMPRYSSDGQVCEIGLEARHYSPEKIRLDANLSRPEIDNIFDELVPTDERGPKTSLLLGTDQILEVGKGLITTSQYKNVSLQIYSAVSTSKKHEIVSEDVAATIRWNDRKCFQMTTN